MFRRQIVHASSVLFTVTMLTINLLFVCHRLAPASAADWFNKGIIMRYHVYVIMLVIDSQLAVIRVGHCVLFAGFSLFVYNPHVLNRDGNMTNTNIKTIHAA